MDFVIPTMRTAPLKKLERKDGLSNIDHDFSDDEFEEAPESLARRGRQCHSARARRERVDTATGGRGRRKREMWLAAEGPEERCDRYVYKKRCRTAARCTAHGHHAEPGVRRHQGAGALSALQARA